MSQNLEKFTKTGTLPYAKKIASQIFLDTYFANLN